MNFNPTMLNYEIKHRKAHILWAFLFLCSCSINPEWRVNHALNMLNAQNYNSGVIQSSPYPLFIAIPNKSESIVHSDTIHIVIEGDGYAWENRYTISENPTPKNPVGLKIALETGNAIYLAKPCQYIFPSNCTPEYWTNRRYSSEIIASYQSAMDQLKTRYKNKTFDISAFSGGAYIALILSAERNDIKNVTTYAGLLNPQAWTTFHNISPILVKYKPSEIITKSKKTNFTHYCGEKDKIIPCSLQYDFEQNVKNNHQNNHKVIQIDNVSHSDIFFVIPK